MNGRSSACLGLAGICALALLIALSVGFNRWCGNPLASLALVTGHGRDILIPTRPAWKTRISPAYWHGRLLPTRLEQFQTARGYIIVVGHTTGPNQWIQGKGDALPPTTSPTPGVTVIRHYSADRLKQME